MVFSSGFLTRSMYVFLPYTCHVSHSSHRLFDRPNNIWLAVQIMKILMMQSPSLSCYFLPARPLSPSASYSATNSACNIPVLLESKLQTMHSIPRLLVCCWFIAECSSSLELRDINRCKFNPHCTSESFVLLSDHLLTGSVVHWCCFLIMY
jgi:hypothetical protein